MLNISNDIPLKFSFRRTDRSMKLRKYEFIKKYNDYNYLYREIETGFYECFGVQDLGLIVASERHQYLRKR